MSTPKTRRIAFSVAALAVILCVTIAIAIGSVATPARSWDGFVAWDIKAEFLARTPSITQDFFAQPEVYCHCRDYPLLQPILIASGHRLLGQPYGRLLFPALYLLLTLTVMVAVWSRSSRRLRHIGLVMATALAVTPALVNPSMGGADSGFAELFLATCLAGIAAGLTLRSPGLLLAATHCAVLVKPEGMLYGALPIVITWCLADRSLLRATCAGFLPAVALWFPIQHRLQTFAQEDSIAPLAWSACIALALITLGSDALLRRRAATAKTRILLAALGGPLLLASVPLLALAWSEAGGTAAVYLQSLSRPFERLPRLPAIALGALDHAVLRLSFALAFVTALVLAFSPRRGPVTPRDPRLVTPRAFLVFGLGCVVLPFLLSPEDDLRHHLRSSMSRLLIHWLGPLWIVIGLSITARLDRGTKHDQTGGDQGLGAGSTGVSDLPDGGPTASAHAHTN